MIGKFLSSSSLTVFVHLYIGHTKQENLFRNKVFTVLESNSNEYSTLKIASYKDLFYFIEVSDPILFNRNFPNPKSQHVLH